MRSSTRRAVLAACTALLLVTAGCSGGTNPTSTATTTRTATTTGAPTTATATTTGTWSPNASVGQYPPGVADNGTLTNVSDLLDAHFDATANESMELTVAWTEQNERYVRTYAHGADQTPYYTTFNRSADGTRTTEEFYSTGSRGYSRVTFDNEKVYRVFQNLSKTSSGVRAWTRGDVAGPRNSLRSWLTMGNYSVNGTVERGGRTFVQLTAGEVSQARNDSFAAYEGTALVTPQGVVYDLDAAANWETEGAENRDEVSITLDTDVEWSGTPSWVDDVPHLSLSIVEGGHAIEIRNTGGAALPANATFRVAGTNETAWSAPISGDASGTVTTDARLEPGEAVYVTAGADGSASSFALHDDRTRGEYTFRTVSIRGTAGNVVYRLVTGTETAQAERATANRSELLAEPPLAPANRVLG